MEQGNKGKKRTKEFGIKNHPNGSDITRSSGLVYSYTQYLMFR